MTEEEKNAMDQYGITCEEKTVFHFKGHKYDRLDDALKYASLIEKNTKPVSDKQP